LRPCNLPPLLILFLFLFIPLFFLPAYGECRTWVPGTHLTAVDAEYDNPQVQMLFTRLKNAASDPSLQVNLAGRPLFIGLTREHVAGLKLTTNTGDAYAVTAFGGVSPTADGTLGIMDNLIYGGKLVLGQLTPLKLGMSYKRVQDPVHTFVEKTGADLSFKVGSRLDCHASLDFDMERHRWRDQSYSLQFNHRSLLLKPYFQSFNMQDCPDRWKNERNPLGFLHGAEEQVAITGLDADWHVGHWMNIGARRRHYAYHRSGIGFAGYTAGLFGVTSATGDRLALEVGRMDGNAHESRYTLYCADLAWRRPLNWTGSQLHIKTYLTDFEAPVNGQDRALRASLGAVFTFLNGRMKAELAGTYKDDPYYEEHFGIMLNTDFRY